MQNSASGNRNLTTVMDKNGLSAPAQIAIRFRIRLVALA
jgi:hypothetical protein